MSLSAAALAGLVAGLAMEIPAYFQRALRLPVRQDVFAEAGLILGVRGPWQRWVGYLGHAGLSIVIAVMYAAFFHRVGGSDHLVWWGAFGGLVHFAVGGAVVAAAFPVVDADAAAAGTSRVGFAYAHYGRRDVLTFLGGHLSFGLLLGLLYTVFHRGLEMASAI